MILLSEILLKPCDVFKTRINSIQGPAISFFEIPSKQRNIKTCTQALAISRGDAGIGTPSLLPTFWPGCALLRNSYISLPHHADTLLLLLAMIVRFNGCRQ